MPATLSSVANRATRFLGTACSLNSSAKPRHNIWIRDLSKSRCLSTAAFDTKPSSRHVIKTRKAIHELPVEDYLGQWRQNLPPKSKLLPILRLLGCADDIPKSKKPNLGYTRYQTPENRAARRRKYRDFYLRRKQLDEKTSHSHNAGLRIRRVRVRGYHYPRYSLASLTIQYIVQIVWPGRAVLSQSGYQFRPLPLLKLSPFARSYVLSRNADPVDIGLWAYVTLGRNGAEALTRLEWLCKERDYRIPPFLLNYSLRHLVGHDTLSIRRFIVVVERFFRKNEEIVAQTGKKSLQVDALTKRITFLRLFRLANYFAPSELQRVTQVYAQVCLKEAEKINSNDAAFCNHVLWAIGDPPRIASPYTASLRYIVDAQVSLMRHMFASTPPIQLNPKGFRGVVRTRIASPRTLAERSLLAQQGSNWPPWKDVIDGYDKSHPSINPDEDPPSIASSGLVIHEMQRAGYPRESWEDAAMILSGADERGVPTPPRRTWFIAGTSSGKDSPYTIWQARIRATRTLNEAWHEFVDFLNKPLETGEELAGGLHVFKEMFRKILQAQKQDWRNPPAPVITEPLLPPRKPREGIRRFLPDDDIAYVPPQPKVDVTAEFYRTPNTTIRGPGVDLKHRPNPVDGAMTSIGDSKDLLQPPLNPARGAHVSAPPPTVQELWDMMLRRDIVPDLGLLKLLIRSSMDVKEAQKYLEHWYSFPRRRKFKREQGDIQWRWWQIVSPRELSRLNVVQFGVSQSVAGNGPNPQALRSYSFSPATIDLASAYIGALTSTVYAPKKNQPYLDFAKSHFFNRIPQAITLAKSFKIQSLDVWWDIIRALNFPRIPSRLFGSSWAKMASRRYAACGVFEGSADRKFKFRDINVCVGKIHKHIEEQFGYVKHPFVAFELILAAQRGWDFEQMLKADARGDGHQPMPFRASNGVIMFETLVGIRPPRKIPPKSPNAPKIRFLEPRPFDVDLEEPALGLHETPEAKHRVPSLGSLNNQAYNTPSTAIHSKEIQKSMEPPITTPRTAHIHAYLRLLLQSMEDDYAPVLRILRWMVEYRDFLEVKNRRLPLIAIRALWAFEHPLQETDPDSRRRREEAFEEAKTLVSEGLKEWGGWPTKVEVAAYVGDNWKDLREPDFAFDHLGDEEDGDTQEGQNQKQFIDEDDY